MALNISVVQDAYLGAQADFSEIMQETMQEWMEPYNKMSMTMLARSIPPELVPFLDDQTKATMEAYNGKSTRKV